MKKDRDDIEIFSIILGDGGDLQFTDKPVCLFCGKILGDNFLKAPDGSIGCTECVEKIR